MDALVGVFRSHDGSISTTKLKKGLTSDGVLGVHRSDLEVLGFQVESGKTRADKIERPVFFGENGNPTLRYEIDAYHTRWQCGLEVEAGRAWMGNAVYRDLVQASVMVGVEHLCIAVPNTYKYRSGKRIAVSHDYDNARDLAEAVYGHSRMRLPYSLILVGY